MFKSRSSQLTLFIILLITVSLLSLTSSYWEPVLTKNQPAIVKTMSPDTIAEITRTIPMDKYPPLVCKGADWTYEFVYYTHTVILSPYQIIGFKTPTGGFQLKYENDDVLAKVIFTQEQRVSLRYKCIGGTVFMTDIKPTPAK